ncbi:hypothetical protein GQY15_06790 [Rhodobacter sphaeroides]|nr:hypothetical protein [Cereibacter sphaeroides]
MPDGRRSAGRTGFGKRKGSCIHWGIFGIGLAASRATLTWHRLRQREGSNHPKLPGSSSSAVKARAPVWSGTFNERAA